MEKMNDKMMIFGKELQKKKYVNDKNKQEIEKELKMQVK